MLLCSRESRSKAWGLSADEHQLNRSQIEDLRLAAAKLLGASRRSFQAEMSLKYCQGSARLTETVFVWLGEKTLWSWGWQKSGQG